MIRRSQIRMIFHGAVFILISTIVAAYPGLPRAFHHFWNDPIRQNLRQVHAIVMATGIFTIATSMALPLLALTARGISWLVWSFVVTGYAFLAAFATLMAGFLLTHPPDQTKTQWEQTMAIPFPLNWINIVLLVLCL
ncbi:MAG: hypothetical protein ACLQAT_31280 [Candidatus Binataceae bacterium]